MDVEMPTTALSHPEIAAIFEEVFQYTAPITAATSPNEVERWDSLQHIALVQMLEVTFSVKLSMDEMMEIRTVADIERVLDRHGV